MLTNRGQPVIVVEDGNFENRSELLLRHIHEGTDLEDGPGARHAAQRGQALDAPGEPADEGRGQGQAPCAARTGTLSEKGADYPACVTMRSDPVLPSPTSVRSGTTTRTASSCAQSVGRVCRRRRHGRPPGRREASRMALDTLAEMLKPPREARRRSRRRAGRAARCHAGGGRGHLRRGPGRPELQGWDDAHVPVVPRRRAPTWRTSAIRARTCFATAACSSSRTIIRGCRSRCAPA